jgi:hypothetical protein
MEKSYSTNPVPSESNVRFFRPDFLVPSMIWSELDGGFLVLSSARYTATPPTASAKNIFIQVIDKRNLLSSFCLHRAPTLYLFTKKPVTNLIPNQLTLNPRHISSSCTLLCQWWVTYVPIYRSFFNNLIEFNETYKLRNTLHLFVTPPLPGSKSSFNYTLLPSLVTVTRAKPLNTLLTCVQIAHTYWWRIICKYETITSGIYTHIM